MSRTPLSDRPRWIVSPVADLTCFGFGWLPVFAGLWWVAETMGSAGTSIILTLILAVNFLHRHATFPLVYGDPDVYGERKRAYRWLPVAFAALTVLTLSHVRAPHLVGTALAQPSVELTRTSTIKLDYGIRGQSKSTVAVKLARGRHEATAMAREVDEGFGPEVDVAWDGTRFTIALADGGARHWLRLRGSERGLAAMGWSDAPRSDRGSRPWFSALAMLSVLWTVYHTLMQKLGILRIYSRQTPLGRSSPQSAGLDRLVLFSWFLVIVLVLAGREEVRDRAAKLSATGRMLRPWIEALDSILPLLLGFTTIVAIVVSSIFLWHECGGLRRTRPVHLPKLAFMASIFALYGCLCLELGAGYAAFGFSHAIEYLCFVVAFSSRKYALRAPTSSHMARWMAQRARSIAVYVLFSLSIFFAARWGWKAQLNWYIVGSSFLHFLYDGWIWKVRRPSVGSPLAINSSSTRAPSEA